MATFLIATRNSHKVEEIRAILGKQFRFLTLNDFPAAPPVVEDATTFEGNAKKKAVELALWLAANPKQLHGKLVADETKLFVLADDSGLEVDALNGAPGVYSARFAAMDVGAPGNSPDSANNAKLLRLLEKIPAEKRTGRFRCVIALTALPLSGIEQKPMLISRNALEGNTETFQGSCEGRIASRPSGQGGFGYDPLFIPNGFEKSFAELGEDVKNRLSHRAQALTKMREFLQQKLG
jgi:XTP/dITP diphosphohydrolase